MNRDILTANLSSLQKLTGRLSGALSQLTDQMPLDVENFDPDTLDDGFLLKLDDFRARFSDLQDFIGHAVIPMFLNAAWSGSRQMIEIAQACVLYLAKHHHALN
jgi:hypothetical protein